MWVVNLCLFLCFELFRMWIKGVVELMLILFNLIIVWLWMVFELDLRFLINSFIWVGLWDIWYVVFSMWSVKLFVLGDIFVEWYNWKKKGVFCWWWRLLRFFWLSFVVIIELRKVWVRFICFKFSIVLVVLINLVGVVGVFFRMVCIIGWLLLIFCWFGVLLLLGEDVFVVLLFCGDVIGDWFLDGLINCD